MAIYLDNNATTRPLEPVQAAVAESLREFWHNPSSVHRAGQAARQRVELARQSLARLIGARPRNVTICGSGTEAIDLAVRGALAAQGRLGGARKRAPGAIITSKVEHAAVRGLAEALEREEGVRVLWAEVDAGGVVSVQSVADLLEREADVGLVSVQWANNETGGVQPVREIGEVCRGRGVVFHCDATQWVGKMVVGGIEGSGIEGSRREGSHPGSLDASMPGSLDASTARSLDAFDILTFSPHKFHGPKGVGVMYARTGVRTAGRIAGEQEMGRRGGTENVPGIIGAGVAAELAVQWLADPSLREAAGALRDEFERRVLEGVGDGVVNGPGNESSGLMSGLGEVRRPGSASRATQSRATRRLWNTTNIGFPRLEAEALLLLLSERGVCASAGAACSSGSLDPSPVLLAMGVKPEVAHGSLRFSLSRETTREEVDAAAEIVVECVQRLRRSLSAVG